MPRMFSKPIALALVLLSSFATPEVLARDGLPGPAVQAGKTEQLGGSVVPMGGGDLIPDRYIVVFKSSVANPQSTADELTSRHGLVRGHVYGHALKGFSATIPAGRLAALSRDPRIQSIEQDQTVQAYAQTIPTGIGRMFASGNANIAINGTDDKRINVDVAVIDTGIEATHPDLNVSGQQTNCSNAACIDGSAPDGHGHGTHVAGTIGALDNDIGVVGVAPGARLWGVKVLADSGSGSMSGVIAGVDWVTARAGQIEVANMSLGGGSSSALCSAIQASASAGVTYVVAAGNSRQDAANYSPANCPAAIAVSALADYNGASGGGAMPTCGNAGSDDTLASFSNYSRTVPLIAAPGVCILSTYKGAAYGMMSGTSMASPHVAGAAALLRASGVSAANVRSTLNTTGNLNWMDTSFDGVKEKLLDVHDTAVYKPSTVAGPADGGTTEPTPPPADTTPPTVSISSPSNGSTVSGNVKIQIAASDDATPTGNLTVTWTVDGEATPRTAAFNSSSGYYEATWDTTGATNASHTISARATDQANLSTNAPSISATVSNGTPTIATSFGVLNQQMTCSNSRWFMYFQITMVNDLDEALKGVSVSATLNNVTAGGNWTAIGTTGSDGSVTFRLMRPKSGAYELTINQATYSGLAWDELSPSNSCTK